MKDPELETADERQARLDREAIAGDDKDVKAADILRKYLSNKVVCIELNSFRSWLCVLDMLMKETYWSLTFFLFYYITFTNIGS
jgi:hypothetical protein